MSVYKHNMFTLRIKKICNLGFTIRNRKLPSNVMTNYFSVLDLDAFERTNKAEGLGMSSDQSPGEKNLHDAEFICKLFRFLQLLCEGHNLGMLIHFISCKFKS